MRYYGEVKAGVTGAAEVDPFLRDEKEVRISNDLEVLPEKVKTHAAALKEVIGNIVGGLTVK